MKSQDECPPGATKFEEKEDKLCVYDFLDGLSIEDHIRIQTTSKDPFSPLMQAYSIVQ